MSNKGRTYTDWLAAANQPAEHGDAMSIKGTQFDWKAPDFDLGKPITRTITRQCCECGADVVTTFDTYEHGTVYFGPAQCATCRAAYERERNAPHRRLRRWVRARVADAFGFDDE